MAALWPSACLHCGRLLEEDLPAPAAAARRWAPLWRGDVRRQVLPGLRVPLRLLCPVCCASLQRVATPARTLAGTSLVSVTAFQPTPVLFQLIHAFKYDACPELGPFLAGPLAQAARAHACHRGPGVLVPVPLHASRLRQRGFNQSQILAASLARRLRLPVVGDALVRRRATPALAQIAADERWRHVDGAFAGRRRLPGPPVRVWLVDDVVTSGSTVRAAAAALGGDACITGVLSLCHAG
jgi:ComF family protein